MNDHGNIKIPSKRDKPPISEPETQLGGRLKSALNGLSQRELARLSGLSHITVGAYISGKQYPRINDLTNFAKITDTDLVWLITGQHYSQTDWLHTNQSIEICPDHCMAPTIEAKTPVLVETLNIDWPIPNGLYCIESTQGRIFRRLQWDEDKQGFWLRCDNRHFEPEFTQAPAIVGKVISALTPII